MRVSVLVTYGEQREICLLIKVIIEHSIWLRERHSVNVHYDNSCLITHITWWFITFAIEFHTQYVGGQQWSILVRCGQQSTGVRGLTLCHVSTRRCIIASNTYDYAGQRVGNTVTSAYTKAGRAHQLRQTTWKWRDQVVSLNNNVFWVAVNIIHKL